MTSLHPRNRHQGRYDFSRLIEALPALADFVRTTAYGDLGVDFADPGAVHAINAALLASHYGIHSWTLPENALCPSVPGRADYVHSLADLLADSNKGKIPQTPALQMLDIGTGASCIYPIIGQGEYGWRFVASDIDQRSLANAHSILEANPPLTERITLRHQTSAQVFFQTIAGDDDWFDLSFCNPPFHASAAVAHEGSQRKWRNLGKAQQTVPPLNFGGQANELWCPGGEQGFIEGMIAESAVMPTRCFWFSSLVSKAASLPVIYAALKRANARAHETILMGQGQKTSRLVAWTFLTPSQQAAWRKLRW